MKEWEAVPWDPSDTCWRELIAGEMRRRGEAWGDVVASVACALRGDSPKDNLDGEEWLDVRFDSGFGSAEGCYFTVWTAAYVYFPTEYDGAEGCTSAPRFPCDEAMRHA